MLAIALLALLAGAVFSIIQASVQAMTTLEDEATRAQQITDPRQRESPRLQTIDEA